VTEPQNPIEALDGFADVTASAASIQPLHIGELHSLGLGSYFTPVGYVQNLVEVSSVVTSLPFWVLIPSLVFATRIALLPLALAGVRTGAILQSNQDLKKIKAEADTAKSSNEKRLAAQKFIIAQRKLGINPFSVLAGSILQVTTTISWFIGVRKMCILPVAQLTSGGAAWFLNLTLPDPHWLLPLGCTALFALMSQIMKYDYNTMSKWPHMPNLFQLMSPISFALTAIMPSGVQLVIVANGIFSLMQTALLRVSSFRRRVRLPSLENEPKIQSRPTYWQSVKAGIQFLANPSKVVASTAAPQPPSKLPKRIPQRKDWV